MLPLTWVVAPTRLPLITYRCHACSAERSQASGKFRVNANHKVIDVWLLALCMECGTTSKLSVLERVTVRTIRPALLEQLHTNAPDLVADLLQDPEVQRRNHFTLDWTDAWRFDVGETPVPDYRDVDGLDVTVRFEARIPVRPVRLIAAGCGLTRGEVERLIADGRIVSAARLGGRLSADFGFVLTR